MDGRFCCVIDCEADAEFEILGGSGHFEDNTDACEAHVGTLLGTPDWLIQRYGAGRENREWTVVSLAAMERLARNVLTLEAKTAASSPDLSDD